MRSGSREYIASDVGTDHVQTQRRLWEIEDALKELATRKRISSFGRALHTREEIEDESLDPDRVLSLSEGVLPVIFLNITYWLGEVTAADLAEVEARFGLRLLGEVEEPEE